MSGGNVCRLRARGREGKVRFVYVRRHWLQTVWKSTRQTATLTTHFDLVLNDVNHADLALSKSAVKPTSLILTILVTFHSSASVGGSEKNPVQLPLHKPSHAFSP